MLRLQGVPKEVREKYQEEFLQKMQLTKKADAMAHTLSGGNMRKLCLSIGVVGQCPVILLDEPTTGLDTNTRRKIWEVIESMKKTSAVILTTHSMEEADALASSISIMVNGQIKADGTSQDP
jgi:ATP-binding cassette subfamily A (ABC1) protein 3